MPMLCNNNSKTSSPNNGDGMLDYIVKTQQAIIQQINHLDAEITKTMQSTTMGLAKTSTLTGPIALPFAYQGNFLDDDDTTIDDFTKTVSSELDALTSQVNDIYGSEVIDLNRSNECPYQEEESHKRSFLEVDPYTRKAKRRRSTLTFLQQLFDNDQLADNEPQERLDTCSSHQHQQEAFHQPVHCDEPKDYALTAADLEPLDYSAEEDIFDVRARIAYLDGAIHQSLESQTQLQNWDKAMGLKKSHSKTMRTTRKSRVKVQSMLKKVLKRISPTKTWDKKTVAEVGTSCIQPEQRIAGPKAA